MKAGLAQEGPCRACVSDSRDMTWAQPAPQRRDKNKHSLPYHQPFQSPDLAFHHTPMPKHLPHHCPTPTRPYRRHPLGHCPPHVQVSFAQHTYATLLPQHPQHAHLSPHTPGPDPQPPLTQSPLMLAPAHLCSHPPFHSTGDQPR
jgi:hypothetical protein